MMKLRWATYRNSVTSNQVKDYALEQDISMNQAKFELVNQIGPVLEYYDNGEWIEVPKEIIIRNG